MSGGKVVKPQAEPKVKDTKKQLQTDSESEKDVVKEEHSSEEVSGAESEDKISSTEEQEDDSSSKEPKSVVDSTDEKGLAVSTGENVEIPSSASTTTQEAAYQQYYAQYQQAYLQQYQQYQQYYAQHAAQPTATPGYDPSQDPIYSYYAETAASTPGIPGFDSQRAARQMSYYFDPSKHTNVLSPEMQASRQYEKQQQQARLTAKEIEAFKKRKQELKKKKNQWFYE